MKNLFIYFKNNNIQFDIVGNEILIKRDFMNHEIRTLCINEGFNIFELDTTIVLTYHSK